MTRFSSSGEALEYIGHHVRYVGFAGRVDKVWATSASGVGEWGQAEASACPALLTHPCPFFTEVWGSAGASYIMNR